MTRRTTCLIGTAAAAALATARPHDASASLIMDLRATALNGQPTAHPKEFILSNPGDTVTFKLFAVISGTNGLNDEQISSVHGSLVSSGSLLGNFGGASRRTAPFTGSSSQEGSVQDIDGDGDLDIGSAGSTVTGKFVARSDSPTAPTTILNANSAEIEVGQFTWTYTGGGTDAFYNFVPRTNATGGNFFSAATWFEDGISRAPTIATFAAGTPVHQVIPEPSAAGAITATALGFLSALRRRKE